MTVTHIEEASDHAALVAREGNRHEWSCPYKIRVDSARDDGQTIVSYLAGIGRGLGTILIYGDREDPTVRCKSIAPVRDPKSPWHWTATLTYSPLDPEEPKPDSEGNPSDDPLDWRYDVQSSTQFIQETVWAAWNVDGMPSNGGDLGYQRPAGTLGPVCNSAGVVYDPPLTRDVPMTVLRVTGIMTFYDQDKLDDFAGRINGNTLRWSKRMMKDYGFHKKTHQPYTVRCMGANAAAFWHKDDVYYRYTYEFGIRQRADGTVTTDGWLETVLDRGLSRRAASGDPDGAGGVISPSDLATGMAHVAPILNYRDDPTPELVLLNGNGQPLTGVAEAAGVFIRWRKDPLADFLDLPLVIFAKG